MNQQAEEYLKHIIFPELERGRPEWDKPHTEAVVAYIKSIIAANPSMNLDSEVLIPAAYAHDWGYAGLFVAGRPATRGEIIGQKAEHMKLGAQKIKSLLNDPVFDYLSNLQKERIQYLVSVHDKVEELKAADELILMEADTLGAADSDVVVPTHTKQEYETWLEITRSKRISRFITDYSKAKVEELLARRKEFYESR